jgi:hypothetical protein
MPAAKRTNAKSPHPRDGREFWGMWADAEDVRRANAITATMPVEVSRAALLLALQSGRHGRP